MPKVPDPDKILKAVMQNLKKSGVLDDVAKAGGNLADDISKIMSEMTGKAAKPKLPKNPPKSVTPKAMPEDVRFPKNPPAAGAVTPAPKGPKPKSPKSGSADGMDRAARSKMNRDNWAKEREAYNAAKRIERKERQAANRAAWAATLEEKYGGNVVDARKATSKGRNRNKKDKK